MGRRLFLLSALVSTSLACAKPSAKPSAPASVEAAPSDAPSDDPADALEQLTNRVCACQDVACICALWDELVATHPHFEYGELSEYGSVEDVQDGAGCFDEPPPISEVGPSLACE